MGKIAMGIGKALFIATVAAVTVLAVPVSGAFALTGPGPTPLPATLANQRLELAWARLQSDHARMQVSFDFADQRTARAQQLIDRAKANGKDVSDVQSALDNLESAIKQARPIFEGANGILSSHQGFDVEGNVTDSNKALETVKDLAGTYREIRTIVQPALQAFRQAVQSYRQANPPTPTPGS